MNRFCWALVFALVACSGTESGNPTRGGVCPAPIELDISTSQGDAPDLITVNGTQVACSGGKCELLQSAFRHAGAQSLTVSATGYADTTITVTVPPSTNPECETGSVAAAIVLEPSP